MRFLDRRTANILMTILLFAVVLAIVYIARKVIIIFAFAILFAYLINPIVRFLQHHSLFFKNLRGPHILGAYLALLILIAIAVYGAAPGLLNQTVRLLKEVPAFVDGISTGEIAPRLASEHGWTEAQEYRVRSILSEHPADIRAVVATVERVIPQAVGSLILIPILAIFFLSDGANLAKSLIRLTSTPNTFEAVQSLAADLERDASTLHPSEGDSGRPIIYILLCDDADAGFSARAGIGHPRGGVGVHSNRGVDVFCGNDCKRRCFHSLALDLGRRAPRTLATAYGLWHFASRDGHELEIHPLLAIFTLMVGGAIGGIVGVYLSLPIVASLRVVWRRFVQSDSPAARAHEFRKHQEELMLAGENASRLPLFEGQNDTARAARAAGTS